MHIIALLLKEPVFLVELINNMIVRIHGFEILNAQLVPLIGSLEKTIVFPIPNVAPENPTTFMDLPPTYTQTLSLGGYGSLICIRSQT